MLPYAMLCLTMLPYAMLCLTMLPYAILYQVDEKWVLPAVLQLGGEPVVTEDGNIAYRFPVCRVGCVCHIVL